MHREIISIGIKLRSPVSISYIYALVCGIFQRGISIRILSSKKNIKGASDAGLMVGGTYTHKPQRLKKQQPKLII